VSCPPLLIPYIRRYSPHLEAFIRNLRMRHAVVTKDKLANTHHYHLVNRYNMVTFNFVPCAVFPWSACSAVIRRYSAARVALFACNDSAFLKSFVVAVEYVTQRKRKLFNSLKRESIEITFKHSVFAS
jgi:hypothetical protein